MLKNHLSNCTKKSDRSLLQEKQLKLPTFFEKETALPGSVRSRFNKVCVDFVASDLQPFKAVEENGLNELAQQAICISAKYGKISAAKLLPSRFTVKRLACDQAIEVKAYLAQAVNNAIKENGVIGMTQDMWSDIKQRHYLGLTVHLISKEKLILVTFYVLEFPYQVKSGDNIGSSVRQTCESLAISQHVLCNQLYFVTDQGSNVRAALFTFHRIPCACHQGCGRGYFVNRFRFRFHHFRFH